MAIDKKAYALANGYTDETVIGGGAIKGKNCTISKIEDIDGGHRITFNWTLDNGTTKSQTLDVKDGVDGHTPVKGVDYVDGAKGDKGEQGISGIDGKDGTTYTPSIGEVTTVESNVEASASVSVNTETKEAVFNFAIPKGNKGLDGVQISDNETVKDKTWSSSKIASKIPTTLPANGGNADTVNNHTVKSDVPENAVFTDTIYDDTELNAKLGELSTYSTEETKVGTWIDGKPIYRKVLTAEVLASDNVLNTRLLVKLNIDATNISQFILIKGIIKVKGINKYVECGGVYYVGDEPQLSTTIAYDGSDILLALKNGTVGVEWVVNKDLELKVIVEYTKVTD